MRFGKQKRHSKIVRFYTACFGFREPFKVLCDGTFVRHLLLNHIMPADNTLSTTLELKSLGRSHSETLEAASSLFIARCDHEKRKPADNCIREIIGNGNQEHFFVATQDDKLRKKFCAFFVAAVPLIYALRNALYLEKPSAFQRKFAKSTEEERSHMSQSEYKLLMAKQKSSSALEEPLELPSSDRNEGHQIIEAQIMAKASSVRKRPQAEGDSEIKFKRKKPQGPNPLSCKKKKDHMQVNSSSKKDRANKSESTGTLRSRKRKRLRRCQIAASGNE